MEKFKEVHVPQGEQPEMTVLKQVQDGSLKKAIDAYNEKRCERINQDILNRNGNTVPLQPLDVTDMEIIIREV